MTTGNQGNVLPDDACPTCGTRLCKQAGELAYTVNSQKVSVESVPHLRCPNCDEVVLTSDEAQLLRQRAFERYRVENGLLSANEIRAIRERFGMTQSAFADLLRLGSNTISRWEAERKVQTASLDVLLRLIRDLPDSLEYLRRSAA
jgi:putative zinc finger/helix-turn-helix YgiT family protein